MTAIADIRAGLATRLETVAGVRVYDEFPTAVSVSGNAAAAVVQYTSTTYDTAFGGAGHAMIFTVTMLAGKLSDRVGREKIDGYLDTTGASSVRAAVNGTLGGAVSDARVSVAGSYGEYTVGTGAEAAAYVGVELTVEVML